jgi:heme-degrading monooxygenase HmoA
VSTILALRASQRAGISSKADEPEHKSLATWAGSGNTWDGFMTIGGVMGETPGYFILWEYTVKAGSEREFERVYGPQGDWVRFFAKGEGYITTQLLRDVERPRHYMTVDIWTSQETCEAFQRQWEDEYKVIDARCEALTEQETPRGSFHSVGPVELTGKGK